MAHLGVVLGTAQFAQSYGVLGTASVENQKTLLHSSSFLGVIALDTSPAYGHAEELIGEVGWSGKIYTKFLSLVSAEEFESSSLQRLRRKNVDVLFAHDSRAVMDAKSELRRIHTFMVPEYAKHLGVSVYTRQEFLEAVRLPEVSYIQFPLNILNRDISLVDRQEAVASGKTLVARSVLLQGLLAGGPPIDSLRFRELNPYLESVRTFAARSGFSVLDLMVSWLGSKTEITEAIFGFKDPRQLREVMAAVNSDLVPSSLLAEMESEIACPPLALVDPRNW